MCTSSAAVCIRLGFRLFFRYCDFSFSDIFSANPAIFYRNKEKQADGCSKKIRGSLPLPLSSSFLSWETRSGRV